MCSANVVWCVYLRFLLKTEACAVGFTVARMTMLLPMMVMVASVGKSPPEELVSRSTKQMLNAKEKVKQALAPTETKKLYTQKRGVNAGFHDRPPSAPEHRRPPEH